MFPVGRFDMRPVAIALVAALVSLFMGCYRLGISWDQALRLTYDTWQAEEVGRICSSLGHQALTPARATCEDALRQLMAEDKTQRDRLAMGQ